MAFYILVKPDGSSQGVWEITGQEAIRVGVPNARNHLNSYYAAAPGEDIWITLANKTPWLDPASGCRFEKTVFAPGQYYPRIARPSAEHLQDAPGWCPDTRKEKNNVAIARGQLVALAGQLGRICQTVHPDRSTFTTYGHDIRNLLILACTEVEAHWRGVLEANGIQKNRYSTNDYVKLRAAMKLDEYAVAFPQFPWLDPISPFAGWGSTGRPTQDLLWYDAYNVVKHNREHEFSKATLEYAFCAVSACFVMILAQYGHVKYSLGIH